MDGGGAKMRSQLEMRRAQLALARRDLPSARQRIESTLALMGYGTDKPERALSKGLVVAADIVLQQGVAADAEKFASEALAIGEGVAPTRDQRGSRRGFAAPCESENRARYNPAGTRHAGALGALPDERIECRPSAHA